MSNEQPEAGVAAMMADVGARAQRAQDRPACHWFRSDFHEPSENFCRPCAEALVDQRGAGHDEIDGGWESDNDTLPCCQTCGRLLSGWLTDHGANEEIEHLSRCEPVGADAWRDLEIAIQNLPVDDARWATVSKLLAKPTTPEAP
jgi:hypothetical protein